jgi:16S rRNA (cytosine967-C5)-methyltransferase
MSDPRLLATQILTGVMREGCSLSASIATGLSVLEDSRDRAFAQELAYGVLRWLPELDQVLIQLLQRPFRSKDTDLRVLLLIGLYQLIHLRTPAHAAVSATVAASRALAKPWAGSLINAVLRNYLRNSERFLEQAHAMETARYAHPGWLLAELKQAWPKEWPAIVAANNSRAPMTLRVNARRLSRKDYLALLRETGIEARPAANTSHGIILSQPIEISRLPRFKEGYVSIQDAAAQLAAPLLDVRPGQRVLDACAAPGGKAAHILETCPELETLIAIEREPNRIALLNTTLKRLQLEARVLQADATRPEDWWDGRPFERILVDAPCSGSGVIRRHPDIKYLKHETDLPALVNRQARLLTALWPLLAEHGKLIYVTCSILTAENQDQIAAFLNQHPDAHALTLHDPWGRPAGAGRQILPGEAGMDGFFYAALVKAPSV